MTKQQRRRRSVPRSRFKVQGSHVERYLVGGVNSPVRAFRHIGGEPIILTSSRGAEVVDHQGQRYVDFIMGWGALLLGHQPPVVTRALQQAMAQGILLGLTHPAEAELARLIATAVPSVEQVRFTVSGTEACMTAIRLARAVTGRTHVLVFEGCYHGHSDAAMAGATAGISEVTAQQTVRVPYNDLEALETAINHYGSQLACVLVEPVAANMGVVPPQPEFLQRLRALTRQHGALLIFDEVVTGFRVARGGAQQLYGVPPDLTTFGKIIGGGLPIGALGGPRQFMQRLTPEGDVYHGGTFAGHPLSMAAGVVTLRRLAQQPPYQSLEGLAKRLADGLKAEAQRVGIPLRVNRLGSMLTVFFGASPVRNAAEATTSQRTQFAAWTRAMQRGGMLIPPSPYEAWFLSTAHRARHVEQCLAVATSAFRTLKQER